jgi:hypothetical protein
VRLERRPSDLDHVVAADHLGFKTFGGASDGSPAEVDVRGWASLKTAASQDD